MANLLRLRMAKLIIDHDSIGTIRRTIREDHSPIHTPIQADHHTLSNPIRQRHERQGIIGT